MKILSFDVGIRNLAYCLFEIPEIKNKDTYNSVDELIQSIHVIDWSVVNLTCDEKDVMCKCENKNGKLCKNKALYKKSDIYYCKKHATECKYLIPNRENSFKSVKKMKKDKLVQYCASHFIKYESDKNKDYYIKLIGDYLEQNSLDSINKTKADNISLVSIGRTMATQFNLLFKSHKIDLILIENQISPIANRMKTIQGMITQYFVMNDVPKIEFISSSNKLKLFTSKKTTYSERKKLGIEIMNNQVLDILDHGAWKDIFNKHKKKDDLADAFLQCLHYIYS
jgi:hypothetical protein